MATVGEPRTFSQPSRKGKKAWRKNVDVTAVQSGLEEVREQITQTGGVIKEQPDAALFVVDTRGDAKRAAKQLGPGRRLRSDEILAARSAVPALPNAKKHGVTDGVLPAPKKRRFTSAELTRLKRLATSNPPLAVAVPQATTALNDLWDADANAAAAKEAEKQQKLSFVDPPKPVKPPSTLRRKPVSLAKNVASIPAVRLPDPGISVNPDFTCWDELLTREGAKAVEEEKRRLAAEAEAERIRVLAEAPGPDLKADDPDAPDDDDDDDESEWAGFSDNDNDNGEENSKKKPSPTEAKRKTRAQRNKEARRKQVERKRAAEAEKKHQQHELNLIQKYTKAAEAAEAARKAAAAEKLPGDDEWDPKIMRKRKFGKTPLPRDRLILQLPDELSESLRTLKPEGNLLQERFRSLRERGLIETRAPVVHKKANKKETEKWRYKDFK